MVWFMDMESSSTGKGATQFISCSITEVSMLMPRSLRKLSTALVRSPVRVCTYVAQGGVGAGIQG